MRVFAQCVAVGLLAAGMAGRDEPARAQAKDAAGVLAAARQALGGEKKLSAVRSFTATGRTRQVRGENLVPIEFEISVELPDKYLRKDEIPAQESGPTASGFNGDELLQDPPPAAPPAAGPPPGRAGAPGAPNPAAMLDAARKSRVTTLKQDFARLALGMFAGSFAAYPLTFTYVGQAEAPQGKADVVDAKGPDNVTLRFFVNSDTHLPIMVSWQPPAGRGGRPGQPGPGRGAAAPAAGSPGAGPPPGAAAPGPPVELRLYFGDYRDVDGMQLPFRLRRATGPDTTEETTFDRFKINAKIDPKKFDVRR